MQLLFYGEISPKLHSQLYMVQVHNCCTIKLINLPLLGSTVQHCLVCAVGLSCSYLT